MFPLPQETMTPKPTGPPDGGWGWVVAAAGFAVNGLSYGVLRSLGLAFPDFAEYFDRNAQETAWVSALALAVQQAASEEGPRGGRQELGGGKCRESSGRGHTWLPNNLRKVDL